MCKVGRLYDLSPNLVDWANIRLGTASCQIVCHLMFILREGHLINSLSDQRPGCQTNSWISYRSDLLVSGLQFHTPVSHLAVVKDLI